MYFVKCNKHREKKIIIPKDCIVYLLPRHLINPPQNPCKLFQPKSSTFRPPLNYTHVFTVPLAALNHRRSAFERRDDASHTHTQTHTQKGENRWSASEVPAKGRADPLTCDIQEGEGSLFFFHSLRTIATVGRSSRYI